MADKKLIATTVSSREKGIRRREEGETTSSQRTISAHTGSKGGGRLKHCIVDGDVPLCLRRKLRDSNESSSSVRKRYEGKGSRSSNQSKMKNCVMNNMASGSKELCPRSTEGKDKHSKKQGSHFYHSSEKHEVYALK